jgi:uncharacterized delta-60 repeat protein
MRFRRGFGFLVSACAFMLLLPAVAHAANPGDLDDTFSDDGMQGVEVGTSAESSQVLVSGGKILVLARSDSDLALVRLTNGGDPDPTFGGGDGIVAMNLLGNEQASGGLGVLPDGKIMAAMSTNGGGYDKLGLARFTAAGVPDSTFGGGDGNRIVDFGKEFATYDMVVLPNGRFLVSGELFVTDDDSQFLVARLRPNGTLDPTFGGGDGFVLTQFRSRDDGAWRISVDTQGRIVAAGWAQEVENFHYDVAAARYLANGAPDHGFSGDGKVITQFFEAGQDWVYGLGLQGDKVVLGLHLNDGGDTQMGLLRYRANGTLDTAFGGGDGEVITPLSGQAMALRDLAIDASGRIVAAAEAGSPLQMLVARYGPTGKLDHGFGTEGFTATSFLGDTATRALTIAASGKIVVAGQTAGDIAVARFLP